MELKKYTYKEAELILEKVSIILGLNEDNIPGNKKLFIELFIEKILNVYGEDKIYSQIEKSSRKVVTFDLRLFNRPISIIWFDELCNAVYYGMTLNDYANM
ncbi:MAG: hypothetical protein WC998_07455 [Candidatus Paceibacterota bacterium]|jgi:hypothetical protein